MDCKPRIQNIVDYLLDAVEARGSMDLIKDVAFPFPIDVLAEVMGADDADKPMFRDWMRTLGVPLDPVISANDPGVEVRQAIADVRRYFSDLAADRRKHPREDLISIMVSGREPRRLADRRGTRLQRDVHAARRPRNHDEHDRQRDARAVSQSRRRSRACDQIRR